MDIKQYGKREKRLVEQVGMARMWGFNQLVIAIIDKHGVEAAEGILEDLQRHATDTATLYIQSVESKKAP
ncbi:hypothetical protein ABE42_06860 [Bacillus thuringiensis]|uniref:Uncharacterized protein n=1 Tax=Bacillus thuringiensis YBT-1518 TaxID=529122 RepID=A0A9W3PHU7_BACTU|nr:hypothetical protein [Bacillus thuringiensis]AHA73875.1 hypothetical protein YBT1518_23775 [Bacillus thuringiensis YBT-1518]MBG9504110.1 hypothetical protein [Bacillus thuringiensis]MBG9578950.1 hypothetical protein [Bacillus thuringiensis]